MLHHHSPPLCVSLVFDLNQQHHKCGKSCQQHDSSLSWRCEYFVSVSLCLCIIMNWQRVIYNLREESFTTCCGSWSPTAAFSIGMFCLSFSCPCPAQSHRIPWYEHKRCNMNIMNNIFLQYKFDFVKTSQIEHATFLCSSSCKKTMCSSPFIIVN